RAARDGAVASVVPLIAEVVQKIGPEKVRALLSVLRDLRISLESDIT
ncbi:MAG: MarR family transcriptional regulator, partial [Tabrizicola sp.]